MAYFKNPLVTAYYAVDYTLEQPSSPSTLDLKQPHALVQPSCPSTLNLEQPHALEQPSSALDLEQPHALKQPSSASDIKHRSIRAGVPGGGGSEPGFVPTEAFLTTSLPAVADFKNHLVTAYHAVNYAKSMKGTNHWRKGVMKVAAEFLTTTLL